MVRCRVESGTWRRLSVCQLCANAPRIKPRAIGVDTGDPIHCDFRDPHDPEAEDTVTTTDLLPRLQALLTRWDEQAATAARKLERSRLCR